MWADGEDGQLLIQFGSTRLKVGFQLIDGEFPALDMDHAVLVERQFKGVFKLAVRICWWFGQA